jgi:hypothetical protein
MNLPGPDLALARDFAVVNGDRTAVGLDETEENIDERALP